MKIDIQDSLEQKPSLMQAVPSLDPRYATTTIKPNVLRLIKKEGHRSKFSNKSQYEFV